MPPDRARPDNRLATPSSELVTNRIFTKVIGASR